MTKPHRPASIEDLQGEAFWGELERMFGGLPAPPRDDLGSIIDTEEMFKWVAAGYALIFVDRALRAGQSREDGFREVTAFWAGDDRLSRGVRQYLPIAVAPAPQPSVP